MALIRGVRLNPVRLRQTPVGVDHLFLRSGSFVFSKKDKTPLSSRLFGFKKERATSDGSAGIPVSAEDRQFGSPSARPPSALAARPVGFQAHH